MTNMHYIGFDIHKKTIAFCEKRVDGSIVEQNTIPSTRNAIKIWAAQRTTPWVGAMEATMFTGWIYDYLLPYAAELKVGHPAMLKSMQAAKNKNDRSDAEHIADLLRCNLLYECYMAPEYIRELRRILRFRNLMVKESTKMKNKTSGILMEVGAQYNKSKLHGKRYFDELLDTLDYVPESVTKLLRFCQMNTSHFTNLQKQLTKGLVKNKDIAERVELLMTIPGVGEITALTWVLEIGEVERFTRISRVISYCGLCSAQSESAGVNKRGPISKKRNKHLQTVLVEAAKLAPRWNSQLAEVYDKEFATGNRNSATLAVARKLAAYMLSVDKNQTAFQFRETAAA
ncbi:MAG: IS110 family transposase [Anaerolineaceae bacterium]|nr:IS110 family transposase [Anaerolineaceae bacterium]